MSERSSEVRTLFNIFRLLIIIVILYLSLFMSSESSSQIYFSYFHQTILKMVEFSINIYFNFHIIFKIYPYFKILSFRFNILILPFPSLIWKYYIFIYHIHLIPLDLLSVLLAARKREKIQHYMSLKWLLYYWHHFCWLL